MSKARSTEYNRVRFKMSEAIALLQDLVEDFPSVVNLPKLKQYSICKYWDAALLFWEKSCGAEVYHLSLFVYDLMNKYSELLGTDLSHTSERFMGSIKLYLVDDSASATIPSQSNHDLREFLSSLIIDSLVCSNNYWKYFAQLRHSVGPALAAIKDKIQNEAKQVVDNTATKITDVGKDTGKHVISKVGDLTAAFLEKCEKIITMMGDWCKDDRMPSMANCPISSKVVGVLGCVLAILDTLFDYVSSLTAFSFDIPLEIGWDPIDVNELGIVQHLAGVHVEKKRRFMGQH